MPPKKRKSTSSTPADLPAKRPRSSTQGPATPAGEKKGRGRPRKQPASEAAPKPTTPGPKRGRGRPPKDPAERVTAPKADTPKGKRGRPKKNPEPNGVDDTVTTSKANTPKGKRGRPKKNPESNGFDGAAEASADGGKPDQPAQSEPKSANQGYAADEDGRRYWLMKAEPESRLEKGVDVKFSIDDLRAATEPEAWDGVRNAVARNHMRAMKKGDYAFFYHSNCKVPGIAGSMEIVQEHSPDESAFDPAHPYHDQSSSRDNPKWSVVHVEFRRKFDHFITLNDLKSHATADAPLENLQTLKQSRLSVSPVTPQQWKFIMGLVDGGQKEESEGESKGDGYASAPEEHAEHAEPGE